MLEAKEVIANINSAKVPTRVASSQALSMSRGVKSGFAAKYSLTWSWPT